jgi:hypothetical protein
VGPFELIAPIAGSNHGRKRVDPAPEQPDDIERRLIGPVRVLEHEDRRPTTELVGEYRGDLMRPGAAADELIELAIRRVRDLEQGPERARRQQPVAGAPEDPRRTSTLVAETPQECCLASPGFTTNKTRRP